MGYIDGTYGLVKVVVSYTCRRIFQSALNVRNDASDFSRVASIPILVCPFGHTTVDLNNWK